LATLASALAKHELVALDTPVWIHHFECAARYGPVADALLETVSAGRVAAVSSELVLLKLLVAPFWRKVSDLDVLILDDLVSDK
jgi:hypothetical protein